MPPEKGAVDFAALLRRAQAAQQAKTRRRRRRRQKPSGPTWLDLLVDENGNVLTGPSNEVITP